MEPFDIEGDSSQGGENRFPYGILFPVGNLEFNPLPGPAVYPSNVSFGAAVILPVTLAAGVGPPAGPGGDVYLEPRVGATSILGPVPAAPNVPKPFDRPAVQLDLFGAHSEIR